MIPESIQILARDAIIATAVQGRRAMRHDGVCCYTNEDDHHCAVGHALTPEQQSGGPGRYQGGVESLTQSFSEVKERLGVEDHDSTILAMWKSIQTAHDKAGEDVDNYSKWSSAEPRPFGVSWSRWFWSRARNRCLKYRFDIGGFPKHLMPAVH